MMPSNLFDPDCEFREFSIEQLTAIVSDDKASVLRRGRALMELGRRASSDERLLEPTSAFIEDPKNRRAITVGTVTVSQLGVAGLLSGGAAAPLARARQLVHGWTPYEQEDFAWLMKGSGVTW